VRRVPLKKAPGAMHEVNLPKGSFCQQLLDQAERSRTVAFGTIVHPSAYSGVHGVVNVLQLEVQMGRSALLWLIGVPIPIIILIALFAH
jgi:hypothetical protein